LATAGRGPRTWFQVVPEKKTLKNRLHLDITVTGGRANPVMRDSEGDEFDIN
jgi:hypothetical protein